MTAEKSQIEGLDAFIAKMDELVSAKIPKAAEAALYKEGERIMTISKRQVPVDTGNLRSTGHVEPPKTEGDQILMDLGYGSTAVKYAVVVHEDMDRHHKVGKAKYLEDPIRDEISSGRSLRVMGAAIAQAVGGSE